MPRSASDSSPAVGERATEPATLAARVDADDVDLAERVGLVRRLGRVHLRPAEPGQAVVVEREQEAFGIEPVLLLAGAQHVDGPGALFRVTGERAVVHRDPRGFVLARRGRCARSCPPASRAGSARGSGTRICSRSRSATKPAAVARESAPGSASVPWTQ